MSKIASILTLTIGAGLLAFTAVPGLSSGLYDLYMSRFGLTEKSTVEDYRKASVEQRLFWLNNMCRDGVCLAQIDWKCGFAVNDDYDVLRNCFQTVVKQAPLSDPLSKLRLICGRATMQPTDTYSDRKQCSAAGGQWQTRAKMFADEDQYRIPR